jgi:hypothetical protein
VVGVCVVIKPDPVTVKKFHIKGLMLYNIYIISNLPTDQPIQPTRIRAGSGDINLITPRRLNAYLSQKQSQSWQHIVVEGIELAADGGLVFMGGGFITASVRVMGEVGAGIGFLHLVGNQLQASQPDLSSLTDDALDQPFTLKAMDSITLSAFGSAVVKDPVTGKKIKSPRAVFRIAQ